MSSTLLALSPQCLGVWLKKASGGFARWGNGKGRKRSSFLKEARASLYAYAHGVRFSPGPLGGYEKRHLCLCDNEGVVLSFTKGRSSNYAMNRLERIVAGISFVFRAVGRWRHLPGHRHPRDGPTRPSNLHSDPGVPGGILRVSAACPQSCCPPGLCRC